MKLRRVSSFFGALLVSLIIVGHVLGVDRLYVGRTNGFQSDNTGRMSAGAAEMTVGTTFEASSIVQRTETAASADSYTNDGSSQTSACMIQHPFLLKRYRFRPNWRVAGVDYCVGHSTDTVLKNPATISMAGVNINTSTKAVTITGNNVTLDGYDFSGWSVVTTAANTSLIHSNFNGTNPGGTQTSVISGTPTSSNLYVGYSTIDGLSGGGRAEFLVEMEGPGLTVEYSWLKNSNSDLIGRHGNDGGDITIQNNVMEQAGMGGAGVHGDYLQVYGPDINATRILYNTTVQNGGITQGFFADNTKSAEIAGNTFTGDFNFFVSGSGPNTNPAALTGAFNVHDNYFDPTHTLGFSYPTYMPNDRYPLNVFTHNVNMVTGAVLQDAVHR